MHWMRLMVVVMATGVLLGACGGEGPVDPPGGGDPVVFDFDLQVTSGDVAEATGPVLAAGRGARVRIEGTYSIWGEDMWEDGACAGVAEPQPQFASAGGANGPVGVDAAYYFAAPVGSALCSETIPRGSGGVEFSLDGGATFDNLEPVLPAGVPSVDHVYEYEVTGQGQPLLLRREDSPADDNYGVLRVTVTPD